MIIVEQKPLEEILGYLKPYKKVLVVGCDGCTQPPRSLREAKSMAMQVEMGSKLEKKDITAKATTLVKQCCKDSVAGLGEMLEGVEAIVSMACGAGVQTLAEAFHPLPVFPAQNTMFIGSAEHNQGDLVEKCQACGDCLLGYTGGICPVALCAKGLMNGPCGGCYQGKCEVTKEVTDDQGNVTTIQNDCAWFMIYERLRDQGRLDLFKTYRPMRDARVSSSPRSIKWA